MQYSSIQYCLHIKRKRSTGAHRSAETIAAHMWTFTVYHPQTFTFYPSLSYSAFQLFYNIFIMIHDNIL